MGDVVLYSNDLYRYSTYATIAEVILCAALFLTGFLIAFQRTVSYMRQISLEIQAMEGGDLNQPVTVRGDNDLTALAESLDAMRLAFRAQRERESSTYAANQALISQMSHDLRTPLTTLLIYTEILRYGKYQGEDQLRGYLDKIDEKAQQIKQLAENLLEYSLASQKRAVEMEPPARRRKFSGPCFKRRQLSWSSTAMRFTGIWTLEREEWRCIPPISGGYWTTSPPIF